ncbi:MAG: histidine-type phosphatase [Opitutaceae bacterium]
MTPAAALFRRTAQRALAALLFFILAAVAAAVDPDLRLVVIVSRHGVRSPLQSNADLGKYAAESWPDWGVPPGFLTPHGRRLMLLLGRYYRARYVAAGLLTGDPARDAPFVTVRADSGERTIESARALGSGLLGGRAPLILAKPLDTPDPLFSPVRLWVGDPDPVLAKAAILGRAGGDLGNETRVHEAEFRRLDRVLFGRHAPPPGKIDPLRLPTGVVAAERPTFDIVHLSGSLRVGLTLVDALLLEYTDGLPMSQVGWGRLDQAQLTDLLPLDSLYFDLTEKTPYVARINGSNLARHLEETIDQAVSGRPVAGAIGGPGQKVAVVLGHDSNLINLGGLLGLSWIIPGSAQDPVLPGGALVFELRRGAAGPWRLRVFYLCQSLAEMRRGDDLTLGHPPAIAPIFIPGCSVAAPGYDAPWPKVRAKLETAIDPRFVVAASR